MAREDQPQYPDLERMVQQRRLGYLDEQALLRSLNQQRMLAGQEPVRSIDEIAAAPGPRPVQQTEVALLQLDPKMFGGRGVSVQSYQPAQDTSAASAFAGLGGSDFPGMRAMFDQSIVPLPRPRPAEVPPAAAPQAPAQPRTRMPVQQPRMTGATDTPGHFANVRYNNPGAQYPLKGPIAEAFGQTGVGIIGGGHQIAQFPTPVHGAAANMNLLMRNYAGMTLGDAISKWSGGGRNSIPGYDSRMVLTSALLRDPAFAVPFMKAIARGEAPGNYPMTDAQWQQAHQWAVQGRTGAPSAQAPAAPAAVAPAAQPLQQPAVPEVPPHVMDAVRRLQSYETLKPWLEGGPLGDQQ